MKNPSFRRLSRKGFRKIDQDLEFLFSCTREMLFEIGQPAAARLVELPPPNPRRGLSRIEVQAISLSFQLLNLVEENAANQIIRNREATSGPAAEPGMWGDWFRRMKAAGVGLDAFARSLDEIPVEAVLTGHPTEARRWSVLDLQRRLYVLLVQLENQMFTPREREGIRDSIKATLELLWRTGEILLNKPLVETERDNVIHYLTEKFPPALELVDRRFLDAARESGFLALRNGRPVMPRFRMGNWVGGDRDGHPFVTAAFTAETFATFRARALETLAGRLRELRRSVVLSVFAQPPPEELSALLERDFPAYGESATGTEEPWGAFVDLMIRRLPGPVSRDSSYRTASELRADLVRLEHLLEQVGAGRLAAHFVVPQIRFVDTFGFHLASLDIRQNSSFHDKAMTQLLVAAGIPDGGSFGKWSEQERVDFLSRELAVSRPFTQPGSPLGPEAMEAVASLQTVADALRSHGRRGIGSFIISMTRSLSDLLVAYALCREAGLTRMTEEGPVCLVRVTPLFETLDDLDRCGGILEDFARFPMTQRSLPWLDRSLDDSLVGQELPDGKSTSGGSDSRLPLVIEAMLGYSDSSKDAGILASQWAVHETQRRLVELGGRLGLGFRFFHGRGGTVSRGAGPTHRFLEALPPGSLRNGARTTEQGEVIAQKYNNHLTAAHNLELLVAGCLGAALLGETGGQPDPEGLRCAMDVLKGTSHSAYTALVESAGFIEFFRQATPIDALENSSIGSRPSRRSGRSSLQDLRAIPWVFSWNQSRFFLPGWYGVGTALAALEKDEAFLYRELCRDWKRWSFSRYLLYNIESSIESASVDWMKAYASLVAKSGLRSEFLGRILEEYELTRHHLEAIMGDPLEVRRPRFYKTLHHRDEWLSLLHNAQIHRLRRWRRSGRDEDLLDVLQSVNAIAAGLRTTG
ncbi:MAG: phosphoenolpyruvate carboxylase [Opitutaceae bacterium]